MTASRLTSVVDRIEKGARRRTERDSAREKRSDLGDLGQPNPSPPSGKVSDRERPSMVATEHRTAEQIRRDDLADLDAILRGTKR
jgi:hypothetical protein